MRQTFTIARSLALVSLFGFANAGYAQTVKSDAPLALGQNAVAVKAIAAKDGTFDVEITHNGKTRKFTGVKATPDGNFDLPELMELNPPAGIADRKQRKVVKVEGKPLIFPSGAAAAQAQAQAQSQSVSVKAIGNGSGTFDVEITENGKTRKLTGLKPGPKGFIEIPSGPHDEATIVIDPNAPQGGVNVKVEGKPLIFPSGAAAAQAHSSNVSVKATGNGSGTFDVEITENGKTRKLTGLKPGPKGKIEVPSGVAGHPPILIDTTEGPNGKVSVRVEGKPLIFPSGAAAAQAQAQAQSQSVSVKAIGNGSGTFDVEITENGKTRKLTGLKPGPKGFIEIPSGPHDEATIVIDPNAPQGGVNVKVEGKPLILPSGAAAAQAQSRNVTVKATGSDGGTFDVEITENGKTRKLNGVTAGPDGSLDIPELNDVAPAGAKISKQIRIINVDGNQSGPALSTIIENTNNEDVNIVVDGVAVSGADGHDIKPGTSIVVTTDGKGNAPKIIKSNPFVVGQPLLKNMEPGRPHPNQVYKVATTRKASKEILIVAKLVNGKKVLSEAKLVVLSGQTAKLDAGDVWLSLRATISPAGTISVKGDAGSAKSPKGPGFSVNGLPSGGSFKYPNGATGTWEIKASIQGAHAKP